MKKLKFRVEQVNQPVTVGNASHIVSVIRLIDKLKHQESVFFKGIRWCCLAKTGCLRIAIAHNYYS